MSKFYNISKTLVIVLALSLANMAWAQGTKVSGKVTSNDDGSTLPGINVVEKGTTNGTATDGDGNYTLTVQSNAVLVFSGIGFKTQEVAVGAQSTVDVALETDIETLSEIVVVGYGTQDKKEITSAVASVSAEKFNAGNMTSPGQLIQGKVAGLSITRPGGDPNQGYTIRLRGITTFGANTAPLVVLDGIVGASLDNVDPNDIASIDVLKDGSAAAIYGARGSSGVILVTTKSGKAGKGNYANVSYNGFLTVDQVANKIDVLSAEEFVARGGSDFGSKTNWFNELTRTGVSKTNNISIEGANGRTTYRAAVNYRDNQGIVDGVDFQRLNTRLAFGHEALNGKLRFNVGLTFNNREQNSINMAAFKYAVIYNPTAPVLADNNSDPNDYPLYGGYFQRNLFDFYNPIALSKQQKFVGHRKNNLSNYRVEYDIIKDLTVALNFSTDRETGLDGSWWSKQDFAFGQPRHGVAGRSTYDNLSRLLEFTTKYSKSFGDLNADVLVGVADQKRTYQGFSVQAYQFTSGFTGYSNLNWAAIRQGADTFISSYFNEDHLRSAFGRFNLNYRGTYFASGTVRSESFSGFGKDDKTAIFPAGSIGVEITKLADLGIVSTLKARISAGQTGNLPPSANLALAAFSPRGVLDYDGNPLTTTDQYYAPFQTRDANPTLKWETKTEYNFGADFGLFNGKLTGAVEYYIRDIKDLLFNVTIPVGAPNPFSANEPPNVAGNAWANVGRIKSAGFEFSATYNDIKLGPVSWSPSANFTLYDKAKIKSFKVGDLGFSTIYLSTPGSPGQNNDRMIRNIQGQTVGDIYGPVFKGVDENGRYVLEHGDTYDDYVKIGNGLPKGDLAVTNNFKYKNFDLSFMLRGSWGHTLYNSYRGFYENRDVKTWNSVVTDKTPYVTQAPRFSSLYVEDATFIRLDNLSLSYNIPLKSQSFSNLRVYAAGQNLFTITKYAGIDPEVRYTDAEEGNQTNAGLAPGIERRNTYFTTRSMTVGLSFNIK